MPAEPVFDYNDEYDDDGGVYEALVEEERGGGMIGLGSPYQQQQQQQQQQEKESTEDQTTSKGNRTSRLAGLFLLMAAAGAAMLSSSGSSSSSTASTTTHTASSTTEYYYDSSSSKEFQELQEKMILENPMLDLMAPRLVRQMVAARLAEEEDGVKKSKKPRPGPPEIPQGFAFDAIFGDNMVLQHAGKENTQSAVYGFLGPNCSGVQVKIFAETTRGKGKHASKGQHLIYNSSQAQINVTQQPFGEGYGTRPCSPEACPPYGMNPYNPWNEPLPTWKILLPPQGPGGNYTVEATCLLPHSKQQEGPTVSITNVTFGDVWYCSGQSNMQLPLLFTFHRNITRDALLDKHHPKYNSIRIMAGRSKFHPYHNEHPNGWHPDKYGAKGGSNPWMMAKDAAVMIDGDKRGYPPLFDFGAACWYFAEKLVDLGIDIPIGLANTAIGGQRIQEYMNNATIGNCRNRTTAGQTNMSGANLIPWWDGELYATQVLPFADMSLKGFVWYQGENNMGDLKGNSATNMGYGCEMKQLIQDWRTLWSKTPQTTSPTAPFGIVTLATSGDEGGHDMGAMRWSQTANFGVLPTPELPNTFFAQAYDLDDEWGPDIGACFDNKCCQCANAKANYDPVKCTNKTLYKLCNGPTGACTACLGTRTLMGGIHPRSKRFVGHRLGIAAYNTIYGGKEAYTGPTLAGCSLTKVNSNNNEEESSSSKSVLEIRFNKTLLRGDQLLPIVIHPNTTKNDRHHRPAGGSQMFVQTDAKEFCMEEFVYYSYDRSSTEPPQYVCPEWAGGTKTTATVPRDTPYGGGDDGDSWIRVNFRLAPGSTDTIHVDLTPLHGAKPTAVRYAWNLVDCCDYADPLLYVTHSCIANCPLQSAKNKLPANPFQARIVNGECECVAPQTCTDNSDDENKADHYYASAMNNAWKSKTTESTQQQTRHEDSQHQKGS